MRKIGERLGEARERLGLTLEEAERSTRIRAHYLAALEAGRLDSLPSPVHARGFLKNYAEFLGLDAESLLLDYADVIQSRRAHMRPAVEAAAPRRSVRIHARRPRWLSTDLLVASVITLAVMGVLLWGTSRVIAAIRERNENAQAGLGGPPATVTATAVPTLEIFAPTVEAAAATPTAEGAFPTLALPRLPAGPVDIRILVEGSAWVRVVVDGEEIFRGRVSPGELLEYLGQEVVEVTTGNGAGLRVLFNGEDQGTLGGLGEVVTRLWIATGAITPTPTATRTPTVTPPQSATPTPTIPVGPTPGG
jgi:transcriptional regulator with XRE-family HTH domain